jgi:uncharacterized protein (TIGR01777 family)
MKIAIAGSTGFIGKKLTEKFHTLNYDVIPLKREDFKPDNNQELIKKIEGCDIVINLAGATIAKRWTKKYKKILYDSRIETTRILVEAINNLKNKPKKFISVSAIGIYDNINNHTENSKNYGDTFLSKICIDWEAEAQKAHTKLIITRLSIVLDKNEGAFKKMILPFKYRIGMVFGKGNQYFSFIHIDDLVSAFLYFIDNPDCEGIYNLSTGENIKYSDFARICNRKYKNRILIHIPELFLKKILLEGHIILTQGQSAIPERLKNDNFKFKYLSIEEILDNLI